MRYLKFLTALLALQPVVAWGAYLAVGPITGTGCSGFVIEKCTEHRVDAIRGNDGKLYATPRRFTEVTKYRPADRTCRISTRSHGLGWISNLYDLVKQPAFFERQSDGTYRRIDVDYIVFKCAKRQ